MKTFGHCRPNAPQQILMQTPAKEPPSTSMSQPNSTVAAGSLHRTAVHPSTSDSSQKSVNVSGHAHKDLRALLLLSLQAVGVIYGDIGTSPLYVMSSIFAEKGLPRRPEDFIGACSLVIWSMVLFVCLLAAVFLLIADHNGEGGVFALAGLLLSPQSTVKKWGKRIVIISCIFGAALLVGDGALTPAISVLSAIEGLTVRLPSLHSAVVPITIVIIVLLFCVQPFGTEKVGYTFSPIMLLWFFSIFSIGVWRVTQYPAVLHAFNPFEAIKFATHHGSAGYFSLGAVFLSVTGLEALYADMGHFGPWPIRISWMLVVFPSVVLNYLGQAANLAQNPTFVDNPFYRSVPNWAYWPMLVLATAAATIASQAIITGAFSLASQAIALNLAPPMTVRHTSSVVAGQVFVPFMNIVLMLLSIALVVGFKSSANMTHAYGVAVCLMTVLITVLYSFVMVYYWRLPIPLAGLFGTVFIGLTALFLGAILRKVPSGATSDIDGAGWITLLIAAVFFVLMLVWWLGQRRLKSVLKRKVSTTPLRQLHARLHLVKGNNVTSPTPPLLAASVPSASAPVAKPISEAAATTLPVTRVISSDATSTSSAITNRSLPRLSLEPTAGALIDVDITADKTFSVARVPGVGVFITPAPGVTSPAFEKVMSRIHGISQVLIFLHIEQEDQATVSIQSHGSGIYAASVRKGFADKKVPMNDVIRELQALSGHKDWPLIDDTSLSVFVTSASIIPSGVWYKRWFLYLYGSMKQLFPGVSSVVSIDPGQIVAVGIPCEL